MHQTDSSLPWVLLRGLGREEAHWGNFPDQCAERLGVRVIAVDLPGCGRHYRESSPDTIAGLRAGAARHLADVLPADQPFALMGISLGGMVALDWAMAEPDRVKALTLVNTSSRLSPLRHRLKGPSVAMVLACLLDADRDRCEKRILRTVSNLHRNDADLLERWCKIQRERPVSKQNLLRQLKAAGAYQVKGRPECPTLVATSRADRMVSWQCSRRIADELDAALVVHDQSGHDMPVDAPQWLLAQVGDWLASPDSNS